MGEGSLARETTDGGDRQKIEEDPQLSSPPPTPRGQPCAGRFCYMAVSYPLEVPIARRLFSDEIKTDYRYRFW